MLLPSSLPLSTRNQLLLSVLLLSSSPPTLASPAALNTPPNIYAPPPPPPPPQSRAYGPDTTPSFALPASTPSQLYLSLPADAAAAGPYARTPSTTDTAQPVIPYAADLSATSNAALVPAAVLALAETDAAPTTTRAERVLGTPSSPAPAAGNTVFGGDQRPIYIALSPTLTVGPDMCPQNTCEDYYVSSCGVRYGGCWDACKEDRSYIVPHCTAPATPVACGVRGC